MFCLTHLARRRCQPYCTDCPIKWLRERGNDIESIARQLGWNVHFVANVITPNEVHEKLTGRSL